MSTPASAVPPESPRKGFHVPVWVGVVLVGIVVLAGGFVVGRAVGRHHDGGRFGPRGGFGMQDGNGGRHWVALIVFVLLIALVVAAVVALVRHFSATATPASAVPTASPVTATQAEELLAQRFARGEIDEPEYRARRDALRS